MSDELLKKISDQQDKLIENVNEIKIIQARQEVILKEHIRRTELLEEAQNNTNEELEPIKSDILQLRGALKLFGLLSVLVAIAVGIKSLL